MRITLVIICTFFFSLKSTAQKEAYIWYFGEGAGLSFHTQPPQALTNGLLYSEEGCASISDNQGRLLFYSNGSSITNRAHAGMKNGAGLSGDQSSTQGVLIVPQPGNDSLYYVFTNGPVHDLLENGLKYNVVNMRRDNGMGEVIRKNESLLPETYERIAAIRHCNNVDIWIVVRKWSSDQYYAFLLTASGINTTPVISSSGNIIGGDINNNIGGIKFSSKGTRLACAFGYSMDRIEVLDFDRRTGQLTNPVIFQPNTGTTNSTFPGAYGLEFSPTNDLLYVNVFNDVFESKLYQFNISSHSASTIEASRVLIHSETSGSGAGGIQIGPDGKLYVAFRGKSKISVIDLPDNSGTACQFRLDAIVLDPTGARRAAGGFPNNIQSFFDAASIPYDFFRNGPCTDRTVSFNMNSTTGFDSVRWDFGDGGSSTLISPVHTFASAGYHTVSLRIFKQTCTSNSQLVTKQIWIASTQDFLDPAVAFCPPGKAILQSSLVEGNLTWSNGSSGETLETDQPGLYWLEVDNLGCTMRDSAMVSIIPAPVISLGPDQPVCSLTPVLLDAGTRTGACLWNTGDTTYTFLARRPGTYSVTITSSTGCSSTDSVLVYPGDCELFLPTAFTPNGDGVNDRFGPVDIVFANSYELIVYNRYGQTVFRTNDPAVKWDGTNKGKPVPTGSYIYTLRMLRPGKDPVNQSGTLVLFR